MARRRAVAVPLSRESLAAGATWAFGFLLIGYLAVSGGGYDPVVHDEVGIVVWWILLAGVATGSLHVRVDRLGWAAFAIFGGLVAWSALAMTWTESAERTAAEVARVATYAGVLALGLVALAGRSAKPLVDGLACACAAVAGLAVLSRLHSVWFPANDHAQFLPEALNRLSYPLNSWNGLASFTAIGLPLVLSLAVSARSRIGQALAAAAVPLMALCIFLTASRGGVVAAAAALLALLALSGDRLAAAATIASTAAGSAILVAGAAQRDALERGDSSAVAADQGGDLLVLAAFTCAGVALLQVAIGLAARHLGRPAWMRPSPRGTAAVAALAVVAVLGAAVAAGAPSALEDSWQTFKGDDSGGSSIVDPRARDVGDRLSTVSGNGRWEYWMSAVDAARTDPLRGIGPGTFEFWWARNATIPSFVRDAHSLYFETLGELGIVGLLLVAGFLLVALAAGAARALRAVGEERHALAAATAAIVTFCVAASVDWVWELAVVPCLLALLAAVVLRAGGRTTAGGAARWGLVAVAILALVAIALPLAGTRAVRDSEAAASAGQVERALTDASTAARTQPYAATPLLQRALVLELASDYSEAAAAARQATEEEPTNWRTWLTRARVEARAGDTKSALRSFRRAQELNPLSPLMKP